MKKPSRTLADDSKAALRNDGSTFHTLDRQAIAAFPFGVYMQSGEKMEAQNLPSVSILMAKM